MSEIEFLTFIDIETTAVLGPASGQDAIIEIAAARVRLSDAAIVDKFETLIKPWGPQSAPWGCGPEEMGPNLWDLGKYHTEAGRFDNVDWANSLEHSHALDILAGRFLVEGATIAGQNPGFDLRHLRRDFDAINMPWPKLDYHVIDLASPALFLKMAGLVKSVSLKNVVPWAFGDKNRKQSHRAMGDVLDSIQVFFAMYEYFIMGEDPRPISTRNTVLPDYEQ